MRLRKVVRPASKITARWVPTWSFISLASMLVKPNTAFTGVPSGRVMGGRAWKARKMNPDPSTSTRCSGRRPRSPRAQCPECPTRPGSARTLASNTGRRSARARCAATRADGPAPRAAAVAGDDAVVHMDDLVLAGGMPGGGSGRIDAERHGEPRDGFGDGGPMIAVAAMSSTIRACSLPLTLVLLGSGLRRPAAALWHAGRRLRAPRAGRGVHPAGRHPPARPGVAAPGVASHPAP